MVDIQLSSYPPSMRDGIHRNRVEKTTPRPQPPTKQKPSKGRPWQLLLGIFHGLCCDGCGLRGSTIGKFLRKYADAHEKGWRSNGWTFSSVVDVMSLGELRWEFALNRYWNNWTILLDPPHDYPRSMWRMLECMTMVNPSTFDSLGLVMQKFMESIVLDCLPRDLWPNLWEKQWFHFWSISPYFTIFHPTVSAWFTCAPKSTARVAIGVEMQTPSDAVRYEVTYTDIENDTINQQWCSTTGFNKKSFGGSLEVPTQENST